MRTVIFMTCVLVAACDDFTQVSESGFGAFEPALAPFEDGIAVAWNDNRDGEDEIYLRVLDDNLRFATSELRLTQTASASYEADVASLGDEIAIAWYEKNAEGQLIVMLGLYDREGQALWQRMVSWPGRNGRVPVLETVGERLFIAWVEEQSDAPGARGQLGSDMPDTSIIWGSWYDSSGEHDDNARFKIAPGSPTTWNLNADSLPDGRVLVAYDAEADTRASEIYLALIDDHAVELIPLTEDDGFSSKYPDIAYGPTHSAITWFDNREGNNEIYLNVFELETVLSYSTDKNINPRDIEKNATRITHTVGDSIGAYLTWNNDTLGLAWNDDDPGQHEIFFQRFDSGGTALEEPQRLTDTTASSLIPAIVPFRTGFALGWNEAMLGDTHTGGHNETRSEIVLRYVK